VATSKTRSSAPGRPLRADARRNRETVLAAARVVFAERGEAATLAEIAAYAQVGIGTVYRHYPSKAALLDGLLEEGVAEFEQAVQQALANPDPFQALVSFLELLIEGYAKNRTLADLIANSSGDSRRTRARKRLLAPLSELITRAQTAGQLRSDFTARDFEVIHAMLATAIRESPTSAKDAWRRYFEIVIDGLSPRT
jgi:AcrR family transcriptional regulator